MLKFSRPLSLLGIGCFLGVTLSTGVPNPDKIQTPHANSRNQVQETIDFPDAEELVSPEVIDALFSTISELKDSFGELTAQMEDSWNQKTQKKMTLARNSAASDYQSINKTVRRK